MMHPHFRELKDEQKMYNLELINYMIGFYCPLLSSSLTMVDIKSKAALLK